jgi:seryl-tRNA synthetase
MTDRLSATTGTAIVLDPPVPAALAAEVERRLLFVSPEITGFRLDAGENGDVRAVVLYSAAPLETTVVEGKLNRMLDADVRPQLPGRESVVWTSPHRRDPDEAVYAALVESGVVTHAGEGQVAVGEPLLSLLECFDALVLDTLAEDFSATRYRYPTLISTRALADAGYFTSFPQHVMLVTRLRNDVDVYREFRDSTGPGELDPAVLGLTGNVDYCLPPTMCYHTFHQHRGRVLSTDRLHVVTARGKSFRYEAAYATTLERLWDFTIREIVFLGAHDEVLAARDTFMRRMFTVVENLGLAGRCEVGNDPFFGAADTAGRIWSQRLLGLKFELRLPVAAGRDIAVGSFNFHDDLFGRVFDIRHGAGNEPVRSGCVGFGLERLVYAFLCQYGLDRRGWPAAVLQRLRTTGAQ